MLRFRRSVNLVVFFVSALFLVWFVLLMVGPFVVPAGSLQGLDGTVGVTDHDFSSLPVPWNLVYSAGDSFCHQMEDRSVVLGGNEMAFCARCTGVWLGLFVGLLVMSFVVVPLDGRVAWVILLGMVPLMVDGGGQLVGWWESTNGVRLVTGLTAGVVGGLCVGILLVELQGFLLIRKEKKTV